MQYLTPVCDTSVPNVLGRNAILRAICPQVFGLFTVKLAGDKTLPLPFQ